MMSRGTNRGGEWRGETKRRNAAEVGRQNWEMTTNGDCEGRLREWRRERMIRRERTWDPESKEERERVGAESVNEVREKEGKFRKGKD